MERSEKPASQALFALGPAKGRDFCGGLPRLSGRSHKRQESSNSRCLAGGVGFLFCGGVGLCGAGARTDRLPLPAAETQPPPDQRLPPRERRTKRRRTAARTPELHRQSNAMEIERSHPTLEPLPTNTDQDLPTPSGPTDLKMLSHTFSLRAHFQGGRDAGSAGRVGEPTTPDSPKESFQLTLPLSGASGRAHPNCCSRRASLRG